MPAHRARQLRAELPAVPAGHRRDGHASQRRLARLGGVGDEELLGVHAVVQRQSGKLQVHAHVQVPARAQRHRPARRERLLGRACRWCGASSSVQGASGAPHLEVRDGRPR